MKAISRWWYSRTASGRIVGLRNRSDEELKSQVKEYLPAIVQEEMETLSRRSEGGGLSDPDRRRLEELIASGNEMTLKKAWARLILKDRGIVLPAP